MRKEKIIEYVYMMLLTGMVVMIVYNLIDINDTLDRCVELVKQIKSYE